MSTQATTPQQASIAGIPPAVDQVPRFAIQGDLRACELRHTTDGKVILQVLIEQRLQANQHAHPVLAEWIYPDLGCPNATAQAAHSRAAALRQSREVIAVGCGIELVRHHGEPVLHLVHTERLIPAAELTAGAIHRYGD